MPAFKIAAGQGLVVSVSGPARERDGFSDIFKAGRKQDEAFEAEPKPSVRYSSVPAEVQVAFVGFQRHAAVFDPPLQYLPGPPPSLFLISWVLSFDKRLQF